MPILSPDQLLEAAKAGDLAAIESHDCALREAYKEADERASKYKDERDEFIVKFTRMETARNFHSERADRAEADYRTEIELLEQMEQERDEARAEVQELDKSFYRLCADIAEKFGDEDDKEYADPTDPVFREGFDPWHCLRVAKKKDDALRAQLKDQEQTTARIASERACEEVAKQKALWRVDALLAQLEWAKGLIYRAYGWVGSEMLTRDDADAVNSVITDIDAFLRECEESTIGGRQALSGERPFTATAPQGGSKTAAPIERLTAVLRACEAVPYSHQPDCATWQAKPCDKDCEPPSIKESKSEAVTNGQSESPDAGAAETGPGTASPPCAESGMTAGKDRRLSKSEEAAGSWGLLQDLTNFLNHHSVENRSDTPDFVLARYLLGCLGAFETAIITRTSWHESHTTSSSSSPEPKSEKKHWPDCNANHGGECDMGSECGEDDAAVSSSSPEPERCGGTGHLTGPGYNYWPDECPGCPDCKPEPCETCLRTGQRGEETKPTKEQIMQLHDETMSKLRGGK